LFTIMIPFDCYYTVCPKRFCLNVIASLIVNIKPRSQIINFLLNRCNPFCGKASSEYHLKVTQLLRVESPFLKKNDISLTQRTIFNQLFQKNGYTPLKLSYAAIVIS